MQEIKAKILNVLCTASAVLSIAKSGNSYLPLKSAYLMFVNK